MRVEQTRTRIRSAFDFTGIDELNPENAYNWGYNPSQYFVPEGSYATKPDEPYTRIDEVKKLKQTRFVRRVSKGYPVG